MYHVDTVLYEDGFFRITFEGGLELFGYYTGDTKKFPEGITPDMVRSIVDDRNILKYEI